MGVRGQHTERLFLCAVARNDARQPGTLEVIGFVDGSDSRQQLFLDPAWLSRFWLSYAVFSCFEGVE